LHQPQHTLDKAVLRRGANLRLLSKSSGAELSILQPPTQRRLPAEPPHALAFLPSMSLAKSAGFVRAPQSKLTGHWLPPLA